MISDSDSSTSESNEELPPKSFETAKEVNFNVLPQSLKQQYVAWYNQFKVWRSAMFPNSLFEEEVFLAYFKELEKTLSPSTLWARLSILRTTVKTIHNIDIGTYHKLIAKLKKINAHHKKENSKVFTFEEIIRFLNDASFDDYLSEKIALIFGICGALRQGELKNLEINNVKDIPQASTLLIEITTLKSKISRSFMITGNFYEICKRYINARPDDLKTTGSFFLFYRNKKCTGQPIDINTIGAMPKKIATLLGLPDPELYTGHTFRRTAPTLLPDGRGNITDLKLVGGGKRITAERSVADCGVSNNDEQTQVLRCDNSVLHFTDCKVTVTMNNYYVNK